MRSKAKLKKALVGSVLGLSLIWAVGIPFAWAATTVWQTDTATLGRPNSNNKSLFFNLNLGASNPLMRANGGTNVLEFANDGVTFNPVGSGVVIDSPTDVQGFGLLSSVATNAMTINLTQKDASSAPTAGRPVRVSFRNPTAGTGGYSQVSVTSALSIVIPSSATLGQTSAVNQYVWTYALLDGASVDLCVSGVNVFFNTTLNSSTQISSGATSGTTLYCASSHSGAKPTVILGRLLVNETTAGTWASNATEIDLNPVPTVTTTESVSYSPTFIGVGSPSSVAVYWRREGDQVYIYGGWINGTVTAVTFSMTPPTGIALDTTKVSSFLTTGVHSRDAASNPDFTGIVNATPTKIFFFAQGQTGQLGNTMASSEYQSMWVKFPVKGWSAYGP